LPLWTQRYPGTLAIEQFPIQSLKDKRTGKGLTRAAASSKILARSLRRSFQKIKDAAPDQVLR
jgi:hypothetical protein